MIINKHGIFINDISQGDKLEVKIFPDSEEIYYRNYIGPYI